MLHTVKESLDMLNTDGGHILLSIFLIFSGVFIMAYLKIPEGKDLYLVSLGYLGLAMKSTGKANGSTTIIETKEIKKISPEPPV